MFHTFDLFSNVFFPSRTTCPPAFYICDTCSKCGAADIFHVLFCWQHTKAQLVPLPWYHFHMSGGVVCRLLNLFPELRQCVSGVFLAIFGCEEGMFQHTWIPSLAPSPLSLPLCLSLAVHPPSYSTLTSL